MCLAKITQKFEPSDLAERKAWKILVVDDDTLETPYLGFPCPIGQWLKSTSIETFMHDGAGRVEFYATGFHVFATYEDAVRALNCLKSLGWDDEYNNMYIHPVLVRGVTLEGTDATSYADVYLEGNFVTLVAKEMFVLDEKNEEKSE